VLCERDTLLMMQYITNNILQVENRMIFLIAFSKQCYISYHFNVLKNTQSDIEILCCVC